MPIDLYAEVLFFCRAVALFTIARYIMDILLPKRVSRYFDVHAIALRQVIVQGLLGIMGYEPNVVKPFQPNTNPPKPCDIVISARIILPFYIMIFYHEFIFSRIDPFLSNLFLGFFFIKIFEFYFFINAVPTLDDWAYVFDSIEMKRWLVKITFLLLVAYQIPSWVFFALLCLPWEMDILQYRSSLQNEKNRDPSTSGL